MSLQSQKTTTTTYRTVNVASPEPVAGTVINASSVAQLPFAMNGYETLRYLVPVQQAMPQQSFVLMQQPMVQPMVQQVTSPVYLQNLQNLSHLSVSSQDSDLMYQQHTALESNSRKSSSVFSPSSSPIKSPEPSAEEEVEEEDETVEVEEVEIVNVIQNKPPPMIQKLSRTEVRSEVREAPQPTKMDTRFFGELLAEIHRKNCDIHTCISDNVSKMRGQRQRLDSSIDAREQEREVEALIPKGATELTKQQIRYLLQTRLTADKSMRLLLSTFSSLREELLHMSEDLRRLESEKESLERDLTFKADQAQQYDSLLEAMRENNRQLQLSLKESMTTQRSLEQQAMSSRNTDSSREFKLKELEGRTRALEKENEMLRQKLAGQASSSTLHIKTEELSRQYKDQLDSMKQEKDEEIQRLRSQLTRLQTQVTAERSSSSSSSTTSTSVTTSTSTSSAEKSLQLKISELLTMLEQRQTTITKQEEEIKRLMLERNNSSKNVTKTIITKRYRNQYPILGLLSDDYQITSSPVKEDKTIVIEQ
ncbi:protein POF1B [Betta splendens]|uniref:Protein POF1B n=1 Tax=Betta splendens TaxID=158456 RepID=A0A6P7PN40_BETSP|nr:protein POF1B [Betta splendens]